MHLTQTKNALLTLLASWKAKGSVALVPTMGALHKGHLSLVSKAVAENDFVVVSIFVNPTQFDNLEDLKKYPKTLSQDMELLSTVHRDLLVFAPSVSEIYPNMVFSKNYDFGNLANVMEGRFRQGHFNGVGTVVEALLTLVMPERAYFGEKDFQQLQIIRRLTEIKVIPVEIVGCPIVREPSGLAMSSRNKRLSEPMRQKAGLIHKTLKTAKDKFGTKSAEQVKEWVRTQFARHDGFQLEYIEITEEATLIPLQRKKQTEKYRAFIAVYVEGVRLIDNIALN
ncbi:MAG: pantoate--beta-alanine ligase [Bacteroidota bacterium]